MLGIKVNNEFLDLPAAIALEMERNNPFLTDDIQGEFSLGLTINYSEKNYRLLSWVGNFYKKNQKYTVDAEIYDNGSFRYAGKLVINQHTSNMNNIEQTVWTGFFTIGSSSFLQDIQDVLLQDVDLGGTRSFPWTSYDPTDGSGGFFQHVHAARNPNGFPYTFYPIYNDGWSSVNETKWMNQLDDDGSNIFNGAPGSQIIMSDGNEISFCPAIYVSYLLERIFSNFGWTITGDILNDTGYKKLTVPSFQAIKWTDYTRNYLDGQVEFSPFATISFDLADHVPQDITIGSLLVSIKNRFGWYFDFDSNTKTATLKSNKSFIDGTAKDWTKYVLAGYTSEYQDSAKIYSLVNNIDSADTFPVVKIVDETGLTRVANFAALPAATADLDGKFAFALFENNYYVCQEGDTDYEWVFYAHNIGDYTPAGADTPIESDISTMPMEMHTHRSGYKILVPVCRQAGNYWKSKDGPKSWGLRFLFYHGMYNDLKDDGTTTGSVTYPYASCHNLALSGTPTGEWVIPYRHEYAFTNNGTYDYWWKAWLNLLAIQDFRKFTLQLPITELKKFSFSDKIYINNVFFIVQSIKEVLPYKDVVEMKMKRIY